MSTRSPAEIASIEALVERRNAQLTDQALSLAQDLLEMSQGSQDDPEFTAYGNLTINETPEIQVVDGGAVLECDYHWLYGHDLVIKRAALTLYPKIGNTALLPNLSFLDQERRWVGSRSAGRDDVKGFIFLLKP